MADTTDAQGAPAQPQRKRLVLKPRSEEAAKKLEAERQAHLTKAVSSWGLLGRGAGTWGWSGTPRGGVAAWQAAPGPHHVRVVGAASALGTLGRGKWGDRGKKGDRQP